MFFSKNASFRHGQIIIKFPTQQKPIPPIHIPSPNPPPCHHMIQFQFLHLPKIQSQHFMKPLVSFQTWNAVNF